MGIKDWKILVSHKETDVKVFLEVLAVYVIFLAMFVGASFLSPNITGFAVMNNSIPKAGYSDDGLALVLLFVLAMIVSLLVMRFALFKGTTIEKEKKQRGKSSGFSKCNDLVSKSKSEMKKGNAAEAKKLYSKAKDIYTKLDYHEKKELYPKLKAAYKGLKRHK